MTDIGIVAGSNYTLIGFVSAAGVAVGNFTLGNTPNGFVGNLS